MSMAAPGPIELLILILLAAVFVVPVLLILVVARMKGPATAPCPRCRRWTVAGANFCHHCGQQLVPPRE